MEVEEKRSDDDVVEENKVWMCIGNFYAAVSYTYFSPKSFNALYVKEQILPRFCFTHHSPYPPQTVTVPHTCILPRINTVAQFVLRTSLCRPAPSLPQ